MTMLFGIPIVLNTVLGLVRARPRSSLARSLTLDSAPDCTLANSLRFAAHPLSVSLRSPSLPSFRSGCCFALLPNLASVSFPPVVSHRSPSLPSLPISLRSPSLLFCGQVLMLKRAVDMMVVVKRRQLRDQLKQKQQATAASKKTN